MACTGGSQHQVRGLPSSRHTARPRRASGVETPDTILHYPLRQFAMLAVGHQKKFRIPGEPVAKTVIRLTAPRNVSQPASSAANGNLRLLPESVFAGERKRSQARQPYPRRAVAPGEGITGRTWRRAWRGIETAKVRPILLLRAEPIPVILKGLVGGMAELWLARGHMEFQQRPADAGRAMRKSRQVLLSR